MENVTPKNYEAAEVSSTFMKFEHVQSVELKRKLSIDNEFSYHFSFGDNSQDKLENYLTEGLTSLIFPRINEAYKNVKGTHLHHNLDITIASYGDKNLNIPFHDFVNQKMYVNSTSHKEINLNIHESVDIYSYLEYKDVFDILCSAPIFSPSTLSLLGYIFSVYPLNLEKYA